MSGTDFFDDDLMRQRENPRRYRAAGDEAADRSLDPPDSGELPQKPVSDFNLTRMARHRKEVDVQTAIAAQELERLKKRQEELEQERRELEELRRRQDEFERGKRELVEQLKRTLVTLERREIDAQRMVELLSAARVRFKELLAVVEALQEEGWPEDRIRDELAKSLGVIEQARLEFQKTMAKIEAAKPESAVAGIPSPVVYEDRGGDFSFGHWFKIGLAVSLPVTIAIIAVGLFFWVAMLLGHL